MDKNEIKKECADLILGVKLVHLVMEEAEPGSGDLAIDVIVEELSKLRRRDNSLTDTMKKLYDPELLAMAGADIKLIKERTPKVEVSPAYGYKQQYIGTKALVFVGTRGRQVGWLASQSDMLADDWYIVE